MCVKEELLLKRELIKDVHEWKEIMNLLKDDGLMKICVNIGTFYGKLIKEFIVNLSNDFNVEGS